MRFRAGDTLDMYFADVRRVVRRLDGCALASRESLIESFLRYVVYIAKRHRGRGIDFEDLIQLGNVAMISAVDDFEDGRGRLANFVAARVTAAMWAEISERSTCIRIPYKHPFKHSVKTLTKCSRVFGKPQGECEHRSEDVESLLLAQLSDRQRDIICRRLGGQSTVSIAGDFRCTPQSVRYHEKCAVRVMFEACGRDYNGETLQELGVVKAKQPKRASRFITAFGETKSTSEWAVEFGMNWQTLRYRIKQGVNPEDALLTASKRA